MLELGGVVSLMASLDSIVACHVREGQEVISDWLAVQVKRSNKTFAIFFMYYHTNISHY